MLEERLLNLCEIAGLERGHVLGAPTLGHAARALDARWQHHLRDEETAIRYAFLCWLGRIDAAWETGLDDRLPPAERILDAFGVERLSAESRFVVGWLATRVPAALGDEARWGPAAEPLFRAAADAAPRSLLLGYWPWFTGDMAQQPLVRRHRRALRAEIAARFGGRGALGAHLVRHLGQSVEQAARRPRLV